MQHPMKTAMANTTITIISVEFKVAFSICFEARVALLDELVDVVVVVDASFGFNLQKNLNLKKIVWFDIKKINYKSEYFFSREITQRRVRKFEKVQAKKLVKSNCNSGSFKLFPTSKIDFWLFLKLQKMDFGQKNFFLRLIYLISRVFLAWTFLNFLARFVFI